MKIKTNSHDILKFSPLSLQLYGPSCILPSFLRLVLSALSLSFLLCSHHYSAPGSVVFHSPRLLLCDLRRGVRIPATVSLHWIWLSPPAPPFMILAWFLLPSTATLSPWPSLSFWLPGIKFLPPPHIEVASWRWLSWPIPAPFSQASPSVALWTVVHSGNAVISWESPQSHSLGCPPSFLTISSLLPLRFPPKLSYLPSLVLYRWSYLFSWFSSHLRRVSNFHLQLQFF